MEVISPIWVRIADGSQLKCDKIIKGFKWRIHRVKFEADVLLLPLSGSEMVLGIQWFSQLGHVVWDFLNLTMQFTYRGKRVKLRGIKHKKLKGIQSKQLDKLVSNSRELSMLQVIPYTTDASPQALVMTVEQHTKDPDLQS